MQRSMPCLDAAVPQRPAAGARRQEAAQADDDERFDANHSDADVDEADLDDDFDNELDEDLDDDFDDDFEADFFDEEQDDFEAEEEGHPL